MTAERVSDVKERLARGERGADIARLAGVSPSSVKRISKVVVRGACGCGRSSTHRGHCHFRAARDDVARVAQKRWMDATRKWDERANAIVRSGYADGLTKKEIRIELEKIGVVVTDSAVRNQVEVLRLDRGCRLDMSVEEVTRLIELLKPVPIKVVSRPPEQAVRPPPVQPYSMLGQMRDPFREVRLHQVREANRGKL